MKQTIVMSLIMLMSIGSSSYSAELSAREKVLVRVILGQQIKMRHHLLKQTEAGEDNPQKHAFAIAMSNAKEKEQQLLTEFVALPERQRLAHAQALAYLGNDAGVDVLKKAAFPTTATAPFITSSGFEISESALCLLYLEADFPDSFRFSNVPNPLYPELDELLK